MQSTTSTQKMGICGDLDIPALAAIHEEVVFLSRSDCTLCHSVSTGLSVIVKVELTPCVGVNSGGCVVDPADSSR